ncbi:uncharacterized protein A4U43_C05F26090 [Asparagus officinalis]|uniref:Bacterial Ig-like domain-containing protein n=1 Tax=Asparagus officinalis TaxID=4686 RepID=A0A5P1EX32_ASPOF|nr:uncharacterized protein A4U43_C05F26090 [Asparagus officinalis]
MGLAQRGPWLLMLLLLSWVSIFLSLKAHAGDNFNVKFVKAPLPVSSLDSAAFGFEVSEGRNGGLCSDCSLTCKLDNSTSSVCKSREVSYKGLHDGDHTFEVCTNGSLGVHCASYNWTIDTVPPTALVSADTSLTSMSNVSVHITFNKPCTGGGGFRCSSDYCSLLVYGAGHVIPSALKILQPDLQFSLVVAISTAVQYGRLVLVMDKNFCTDAAGNKFTRTSNSSFLLHIDRRNVSVQLRTHIPKKLLHLNGKPRTVEATNSHKDLRVYLYFSEPVLNSSAEIYDTLRTNTGSISPINGDSLGYRRFGYMVSILSSMSIVTVTCETSSIISRQGTPSLLPNPVTFLYDAQRPTVKLSTTSHKKTRAHNIPVLIKFVKPVFDFNSSSISVSGGHLLSFHDISRSVYRMEVYADDSIVSIVVPENTTVDVAGNKNLASNLLQLRHYSVPTVSSVVSTITTVVFAATSMAAILLTVSTANLLSSELFSKPVTYLISEPSRNLVRIACHIQVFALTRWLAVSLPIDYYEFARGIEWSIPYLSLPWEIEGFGSFTKDSTSPFATYSELWEKMWPSRFSPLDDKILGNSSIYGTPLTPMEYRLFLEDQNMQPEAELIMGPQNFDWWKYFGRNMFWLAVIGGGLMVLHAVLLLISKLKRKKSEEQKEFGALVFPRFEIFLLILALPCICQASAAIIKGRSTAGIAVGVILFGISAFLLLSLLLFLSIGITFGKLLHYKEVHQEGQLPPWFQELVRISLGPGIHSTGYQQTSRTSTLIILSISAFQLFFLVLKKPFIKKRVQFVEIVTVVSELFVFAASLVILEHDFSESGEKTLGFVMLGAFIISFVTQLINEWYSLYSQVVRLSPSDAKFITGLKTAVIGILFFVLPSRVVSELSRELYEGKSPGTGTSTGEKPWMRQLRELAKESFSKEEEWTVGVKDPSSSKSGFWSRMDPSTSKSGFWSGNRSGSSSVTSSSDFKSKGDLKTKSKGLYKDLEAIFSSK